MFDRVGSTSPHHRCADRIPTVSRSGGALPVRLQQPGVYQ
jgi:hypothetical protein